MNNFCPSRVRNLITKSEQHSATASVVSSSNFTVDKQRGDVVAISFTVANETIAVVDGMLVSFQANNVTLVENSPAIVYSPVYSNDKIIYKTLIKGGSTIRLTTDNDQATVVLVYVDMYFADEGMND